MLIRPNILFGDERGYMAEFNDLYQRAIYYDIVFKREVTQEIDFITQAYGQINGRMPQSLIDLACGPGYHARSAAKIGMRAIGLDLREEMLLFAADQAALDGVHVEWIAADMRHLQLKDPVDIAINVFDGIDCLNSNDDLVAHFHAIAANLTPGGIYIIDVTNPSQTSINSYHKFQYAGERDGVSVKINWAINDPKVDPVTHIAQTQLEMLINEHGQQFRVVDYASERVLTAQEIVLLARLAGTLEPVAWYGDYDLNLPFTESTPRMIAILQKT